MEARIVALDNDHINLSMGRVIAQVVLGHRLLGRVCTIFMSQKRVSGLTTAASLWNAACLGLAAGMGYYWIAGIGCVLVMVVLMALGKIMHINSVKKVVVQFIHRKRR